MIHQHPGKAFVSFGFFLEFDHGPAVMVACLGCRQVMRFSDETSKAARQGLRDMLDHLDTCPQFAEREAMGNTVKQGPGPVAIGVRFNPVKHEMEFSLLDDAPTISEPAA